MLKSDFYYDLPNELIAQVPLKNRDHSKLMVLSKDTGKFQHEYFYNIINYLNEGDCLVLNDTKVIPARLIGKINNSVCEILLLKRLSLENDNEIIYECIVRPGKKLKIGKKVFFSDKLSCEIIDVLENGNRIVKFIHEGIFEEILDELGLMPLPPYITEKLEDKDRYQTIYAKNNGSAAAPTAGLHFTEELLNKIKQKGIIIAYVTLHVGLSTFRPVKTENILDHKMHTEYFQITKENADKINSVIKSNKKIYCVGTTSLRVLESLNEITESSGETSIFIYPGYKFKYVDGLITNFHLPESTLIMLVSALSKKEYILNAYNEAIKANYRFFSFGDAMFIH